MRTGLEQSLIDMAKSRGFRAVHLGLTLMGGDREVFVCRLHWDGPTLSGNPCVQTFEPTMEQAIRVAFQEAEDDRRGGEDMGVLAQSWDVTSL